MDADQPVKYSIQAIGLFGCLLMFAVYSQTSMRRLSVSIYFRSLAVVQTCKTLYYLCPPQYFYLRAFKYEPTLKLLGYVQRLFFPITIWLQVMANFDRFCVIMCPKRFVFLRRRFGQRLVVATVIIYNAVYYSFVAIKIKILGPESSEEDRASMHRFSRTVHIVDFVNSTLLTFLLMLALSIGILIGIRTTRRRFKTSIVMRSNSSILKRKTHKDIKFGVTVILLNVMFLIFEEIFRADIIFKLDLLGLKSEDNPFTRIRILQLIQSNLGTFYFSIIFFVQLSVNSFVRNELWQLCQRIWTRLRGVFNHSSSYSTQPQLTSKLPCNYEIYGCISWK